MKRNGWLFITFGLLLFILGSIGYIRASSLPSIICSSMFALFLLFFGYRTSKGHTPSEHIAFFGVVAIDLFFLYRFFKAGTLFPAGFVVLLSSALILTIYLSKRLRQKV